MLKKFEFPKKGMVIIFVSMMLFCFLLSDQQKEVVEAKRVFKIKKDNLFEQVMISLESNDIFITNYDLKKGTIETEFKNLKQEKIQAYTVIDLTKTGFDIFRYKVNALVKKIEGKSIVEVSTVLKAYGRRNKHQGARPHWYTLKSNGKLETKISNLIDVKKRR